MIDADFKKDLEDYLGSLKRSHVRTLKELIDWNIAHKDIALPEGWCHMLSLLNRTDMLENCRLFQSSDVDQMSGPELIPVRTGEDDSSRARSWGEHRRNPCQVQHRHHHRTW